MRDQDRFRGCLIGGAAGDALGYTVEFMSEGGIFSRYGKRGISEYDLKDGAALISDDTQMTLFTAAGLLLGTERGAAGNGYAKYIHSAYMDWLSTQEGRYPLPEGRQHSSWLVNVPGLFRLRAPGNTCLAALRSGKRGSIGDPVNKSKGCGGVMRVAPVGLYFNDKGMDIREIARLGADAAAITHGHTLGWMPAAAFAQMIHEISQNDENVPDAVLHALDTVAEMWPETEERQRFVELMEEALDLSAWKKNDLDAVHRLGEGWVAEETLAIAVYCAVKYEHDFDQALIAAVNHKGDSDSTGAVAENILGARLGLKGIPEKYTENLELKDVILKIADDLYRGNSHRQTEE